VFFKPRLMAHRWRTILLTEVLEAVFEHD